MLALIMARLGFGGCAAVIMAALLGAQTLRLSMADHTTSSMKAAQKVAEADVAAHEASASGISSKASVGLSEAQVQVVTKYRMLAARLPVDVPEGADRDCVIPKSFVNLFNAAVSP